MDLVHDPHLGHRSRRRAAEPLVDLQRRDVDQLAQGMVLKSAVKYQRIAQSKGVPRDNH